MRSLTTKIEEGGAGAGVFEAVGEEHVDDAGLEDLAAGTGTLTHASL